MNIIHDIVIYLLALGSFWLISYFKKSGSNQADKKDMRDISYEGKKGGNVADDEDSITRSQRERLIRILYLAEKINQYRNKYFLYFYDITNRAKFDQLIEDLNNLLTDLYHEQRLANFYLNEEEQKILDELLTMASGVASEMCVNAGNAVNFISTYNKYMELTFKDPASERFYMEQAIKSKGNFEDMRDKKLQFANDYTDAIQSYANWLGEYLKQDIKVME